MTPASVNGTTIGIDIGGTNVRAARVRRDGSMAQHMKVRTESHLAVTDLVGELCRKLLDDDVEAIGIGIPGRLDRDRSTVLSAGFVDLAGSKLADTLAGALGRPVVLGNDAHMALVAELRFGAAAEANDVIMFTVGTGIGGAVAVDRALYRGRGNAGQLGHLAMAPDGPPCRCGRSGCLEMLASGTALIDRLAASELPPGTTIEVLLARSADDSAAAALLRDWAGTWRRAIDSVVAVYDPDMVVLGGGLGQAAIIALETYFPTTSDWVACPVVLASMGDHAGVVGAGLSAFDR